MYPFFAIESLRAHHYLLKKFGRTIIVVSCHCDTCHKRVDSIVPLIDPRRESPRTSFEHYLFELRTNCNG